MYAPEYISYCEVTNKNFLLKIGENTVEQAGSVDRD